MYCNSCGHLNDDSSNYCTNDGAKLHLVKNINASFKKVNSNFCSSCGESGQTSTNYCHSCGSNQLGLTYKKDIVLNSAENVISSIGLSKNKKTSAVLDTNKVKTAMFGVLLSFVVVITLSFIINEFASDQINDFLKSEGVNSYSMESIFEELEEEVDVPKPDPFIGVTDYMLLSHMIDSKVSANVEGKGEFDDEQVDVGMSIETATGSFVLLFVPFLALFAGGLFYARRNPDDTVSQRLKAAAVIGAGYGLLLATTTLFGGFSYDAKISEDFAKATIEIDNNYSFFGAIVNGFVLGTLFAGLGALMQQGSLRTSGNLSHSYRFGESIHQGIGTFFRGVLIMAVVAFITVLVKADDLENAPWSLLIVFCAQAGLYLWNLLNLPSLSLKVIGDGEEFSVKYSLIGGLDEKTADSSVLNMIQYFFGDVINAGTILYPSILIMITLFVYAGYRIGVKSGDDVKNIAIFGLSYAFLMSFFVAITKIGAVMSADQDFMSMGEGELFIGFSIMTTFLFSFLLSSALAYAGGYIARMKQL
jgi:Double zinc ribbon